jgi:hypothetical protein
VTNSENSEPMDDGPEVNLSDERIALEAIRQVVAQYSTAVKESSQTQLNKYVEPIYCLFFSDDSLILIINLIVFCVASARL